MDIVGAIGAIIAALSAVLAWWQASIAKKAAHQASLLQLFASFDSASQATLANPELLHSVHGLSPDVPLDEARCIAYLSMLLDAFQHFYGEAHGNDFAKMAESMKQSSTFLNRILSVPGNLERWNLVKQTYYGGFDRAFVSAVDEIIAHEHSRRSTSTP